MSTEKLNEDCGCGSNEYNSEPKKVSVSRRSKDPNVGKMASLFDGRQAIVEDSILGSGGNIIGYILTNEQGAFRVFKDKIQAFNECEGMASLDATPGMGEVEAPTSNTMGSGDKFPTLGVGTSDKKTKAERKKQPFTKGMMDFAAFSKAMKKLQFEGKGKK